MSSVSGFVDQTLIKSPHIVSRLHKPTHLNRYLNFRSEHPIQQKQAVVNTLFERLKKFPPQPRTWTSKWSMWNGLSCWIFATSGWFKTKRRSRAMDFLSLCLKLFYRKRLTWESLWNELWRNSKRTIFKRTVHSNQEQSYLQETISYPSVNLEVLSMESHVGNVNTNMEFHVGNVNTNTLGKGSEAWALDSKNTTGTLCLKVLLKIQRKQL